MPKKACLLFSLVLIAACFYYLARWPISATDTDLWYHLNGGRYIFETGTIAKTSFFSFIEPQRVWVDYYWLFQLLVYRLFSWSGYGCLILFRALLSAATLVLLFFYFFRHQKEREAVFYYTLLFVFYVLLFLPRSLPVRPHLLSYLFIIFFLYVLELKRVKVLWLLVPAAVLWVNLHGIEYPVLLLIVGAYLIEFICQRLKGNGEPAAQSYVYPAVLALCVASVLCTPHGIRLLAVPFRSMAQVSQFVYELRPLSAVDFVSFFGVLFLLAAFAALSALRNKRMRISHLVLLLGGLALLPQAKRFVNEYSLLVLPLLRAYLPVTVEKSPTRMLKFAAVVLGIAFMAMPFIFMHWFFAHPPRYPLSARGLPEGVASFLKEVNRTGSILNHPDTGGYYEWELYPTHKIFMDLQVPFLFSGEDFEMARDAYTNPRVLQDLISRYRPSFVTVPVDSGAFKRLIADHPQYRPIFFDDAEVLYADGTKEAALVSRYEIKAVDPFALYGGSRNDTLQDRQVLDELLRLSKVYPDIAIVNAAIVTIYQRWGWRREAIPYAESIIRTYPESHLGYRLKANLLAQLGSCTEAMPFYKKGLDRSEAAVRNLIRDEAAACEKNKL
ncbi:MAG TPA: hypothetical protein VMT71_04710 [Syntrophorhabdales bacterium]|nr:hypothetical protein [Syntrophorhabdales bacterium]